MVQDVGPEVSAIFARAAEQWSEMQADFLSYRDDAYWKALEATNGVLVNAAGKALHIDGFTLFQSARKYAEKYASEELLAWWEANPRLTLKEFEAQWVSGNIEFLQEVA